MAEKSFPSTVPEEFWRIVENAHGDLALFREILKKMNRGRMVRFYWTYEELANQLRTERYWSYVHPKLSEDGLAELANWAVAQGKEYYEKLLEHPNLIPPEKNDVGLLSELIEEYEHRYHSDLPENNHQWNDNWEQQGKKSPWS